MADVPPKPTPTITGHSPSPYIINQHTTILPHVTTIAHLEGGVVVIVSTKGAFLGWSAAATAAPFGQGLPAVVGFEFGFVIHERGCISYEGGFVSAATTTHKGAWGVGSNHQPRVFGLGFGSE
ncbi:hypothetical protein Tco_0726353 [Tanacetum coccineum]|uniref:Uncharacterized protein n=1 Tax=Tanacetum coccineum TaxID=301880 RepID=A0ABQ4YG87_9ASTR